jgi:hypothetical protein
MSFGKDLWRWTVPLLTCAKCGRGENYPGHDFRGTWWKPVWWTRCVACEEILEYDVSGGRFDQKAVQEALPEEARRRSAYEAEPWSGLSEFWIQIYLREHAAGLGIRVIEGLRPSGPDFRVEYRGRQTDVEVEHRWDDYLRHKHHLDWKYRSVGVVAVVSTDEPMPILRPLLPASILYLPKDDFVRWQQQDESKFAREVRELEGGQFTSFRLDKLNDHERYLLTLQGLVRRIATNNSPDCTAARDELVAVLNRRDDPRAAWLRDITLPKTSRLVDLGALSSNALAEALLIELRGKFPEYDQKVDLKQGIGPHLLRRTIPGRERDA